MEDDENDLNIPSFGVNTGNHFIKSEPGTNGYAGAISGSRPKSPFPNLNHHQLDPGVSKKNGNPTGGSKNTPGSLKPVANQDSRWRLFFGLALFVVTFVAALWILNGSQKGLEVIIAVREIQPGQPVTNADLSTAKVSVSPELAANLFSPAELNSLINSDNSPGLSRKVASRLLRTHQPVMRGDIVPQTALNKTGVPEGMVGLSLPVSAATAAARINQNDLVTLLYFDKDAKASLAAGQSQVLAEGVKVLDITRSTSGFSLNATGNASSSSATGSGSAINSPLTDSNTSRSPLTNLTLLVTLEQARVIVAAKEQGVISVVLLPGIVSYQSPDSGVGATPETPNPLKLPVTTKAGQ